jgi:hypothetical protein
MKLTRETLKQIIKEELEAVTNEAYDIGPLGAIEPRDEKPSVNPEEIGADPAAPDFEEAVAQLSEKYTDVPPEMLRAMVADMFRAMGTEGY